MTSFARRLSALEGRKSKASRRAMIILALLKLGRGLALLTSMRRHLTNPMPANPISSLAVRITARVGDVCKSSERLANIVVSGRLSLKGAA